MSVRSAPRGALGALLIMLSCVTGAFPLGAQWADDPIIPRGEIFLRLGGAAQAVDELYAADSGAPVPIGAGLRLPRVGVDEAPQLAPLEARFQALAGGDPASALNLGATRARYTVDEQVVPLGLSYGVFDRLTVGVTVPFIRKRIDGIVRVDPEGANVGMNPGITAPDDVSAFVSGASGAFLEAEQAVNATCQAEGPSHPDCVEGQAFLEEADAFLSSVELAYADDLLFPLLGSDLGGLVAGYWNGLLDGFAVWGAQAPSELPLAVAPVGDDAFRALVVRPAWAQPGFPLEALPSFLELGDVEIHVALGLLQSDEPSERGVHLRSAAVGTLRLPTGQPDSLRHVAPTNPPRGVGGAEVRWVADLLLPYRLGVLGVVEAGWHASRDMALLVPDPARPFSPAHTRADVRWRPGAHVRVGITPRIRLASAISVGAGWHILRRRADTFEPLAQQDPEPPSFQEGHTLQSISLELRYTARHGPLAETVPLPFDLFLRWSRTVSGSGELAPVERRLEAGAFLRIRD